MGRTGRIIGLLRTISLTAGHEKAPIHTIGRCCFLSIVVVVAACSDRNAPVAPDSPTDQLVDLLDRPEWSNLADRPGVPLAAALSAARGGPLCTTLNFDAGNGTPNSYTESGIVITSLYAGGLGHLHLEAGPFLLNHTGCCTTPFEFKRTDGSPFTVASLDIVPDGFGGPFAGSATFVSSSGAVLPRPATVGTLTFPDAGWTGITSFLWNEFTGFTASIDNLVICEPLVEVDIDIKPGSDPNSINRTSKGRIPVAILTTDGFHAADVDPATVTLGNDDGNDTSIAIRKNGSLMTSLEDVDGDGDLDLMMHFDTQALVSNGDLDSNSTALTLNGETLGGQVIQGGDNVNIVPTP